MADLMDAALDAMERGDHATAIALAEAHNLQWAAIIATREAAASGPILDRPIPAGATERATPVSQGVDPPALTRSLPAAPQPGRPSSESSHESDGAK